MCIRDRRPFGMRICFMAEYFLPDVSRMRQWDCGYALKVLGPADFAGLYLSLIHISA